MVDPNKHRDRAELPGDDLSAILGRLVQIGLVQMRIPQDSNPPPLPPLELAGVSLSATVVEMRGEE